MADDPKGGGQPNFVAGLQMFAAIIALLVGLIWLGFEGIDWLEITPDDNAVFGYLMVTTIIMAFAGAVLWKIITGGIDLTGIIAEPAKPDQKVGKASLSRFQMLLFTFVVAGLFLMLSIEAGAFVNIPGNVLGLIGISGGTYVLSKTVGKEKDDSE